jgi:hypothetical protein
MLHHRTIVLRRRGVSVGEILSGLGIALGILIAAWAAGAATLAARYTKSMMESAQEQVRVSQEQFRQSVKAQQDALLPVLIPIDTIVMLANTFNDERAENQIHAHLDTYNPGMPLAKVSLKNAGPGIAFNVRGVLIEPEPEKAMDKIAGRLHGYIYPGPFQPGEQWPDERWSRGGMPITGDTEIVEKDKRYKLYAPKRSTADAGTALRDARLTLTYTDLFGRKHAVIYDHTVLKTWEQVAYLSDIDEDLADIERKALRFLPPNGAPRISAEDYPGVLPPLN